VAGRRGDCGSPAPQVAPHPAQERPAAAWRIGRHAADVRDAAGPGGNYYREFVKAVAKDAYDESNRTADPDAPHAAAAT